MGAPPRKVGVCNFPSYSPRRARFAAKIGTRPPRSGFAGDRSSLPIDDERRATHGRTVPIGACLRLSVAKGGCLRLGVCDFPSRANRVCR